MHGNDTPPVRITYLEISNKNMILTNNDLLLNCCSLKAKRSEKDKRFAKTSLIQIVPTFRVFHLSTQSQWDPTRKFRASESFKVETSLHWY